MTSNYTEESILENPHQIFELTECNSFSVRSEDMQDFTTIVERMSKLSKHGDIKLIMSQVRNCWDEYEETVEKITDLSALKEHSKTSNSYLFLPLRTFIFFHDEIPDDFEQPHPNEDDSATIRKLDSIRNGLLKYDFELGRLLTMMKWWSFARVASGDEMDVTDYNIQEIGGWILSYAMYTEASTIFYRLLNLKNNSVKIVPPESLSRTYGILEGMNFAAHSVHCGIVVSSLSEPALKSVKTQERGKKFESTLKKMQKSSATKRSKKSAARREVLTNFAIKKIHQNSTLSANDISLLFQKTDKAKSLGLKKSTLNNYFQEAYREAIKSIISKK